MTSKLGLPVKSVACPSSVKLKKGLVTMCQVTLAAGETEPFTITQKDASGHVQIQPASLLSTGVEKTIATRLAAQGVKATAKCPQHVAIRVGAKVVCTATDSHGVKAGIVVTITDAIGSYSLSVR